MELTPEFWEGLIKIIFVNILLSGDNAVVIALASRSLPPHLRSRAIWFGALGAVVLRLIFSLFIVQLMAISYLKIIGAILLVWIGVKMIVPEHSAEEPEGEDGNAFSAGVWAAIRTIVIADAVMSLDNVIAIAAAADGNFTLIAIGLAMSVPLIIYGSTLVLHFLIRYPILVMFGAGLIGWIAGEIWITDPAIAEWTHEIMETYGHWLEWASAAAGAIFVVGLGKIMAARAEARRRDHRVVDLASGETK
ncbi:MAG: TerC family protein [Micropepsaceae bacterium]